jgi:nicotinamide riboside kinase
MRIELSEEERQLLLSLLDELLGDLRDEIYRAESHDFKERLKAKKEVVKGLLGQLRPEAAVPAGAA